MQKLKEKKEMPEQKVLKLLLYWMRQERKTKRRSHSVNESECVLPKRQGLENWVQQRRLLIRDWLLLMSPL